jgi:DnaJ-class molecular chaperone
MGTLIVIAAVGVACYYVSLRRWPEKKCRRCRGGGRNKGSNAKRFGRCKRCSGSGRELRLGARLLDRRKR